MQDISTRPYLLRALYEWCTDNGYTPHIAVKVDDRTRVPRQFVRDGEIVLNISFEATSQMQMGNELIEFHARFSGKSHKIEVPVENVLAIYARENGQGMAFPVGAGGADGDTGLTLFDEQDAYELTGEIADVADNETATGKDRPDTNGSRDGTTPDGNGGGKAGKGHLKIVK